MDRKLVWANAGQATISALNLGSFVFDVNKTYLFEVIGFSAGSSFTDPSNIELQVKVGGTPLFTSAVVAATFAVAGTPANTGQVRSGSSSTVARVTRTGLSGTLSIEIPTKTRYNTTAVEIYELL